MTLDKSLTVVSDLDHISDLSMDYRSDQRAVLRVSLSRVSVLCNAEIAIVLAHGSVSPSVCLSVRLSHSGIVSKRIRTS